MSSALVKGGCVLEPLVCALALSIWLPTNAEAKTPNARTPATRANFVLRLSFLRFLSNDIRIVKVPLFVRLDFRTAKKSLFHVSEQISFGLS